MEKLVNLWHSTGLYHIEPGQIVMILVGLALLWLAVKKGFEPLLLVPIGFGGILANIPVAGLAESAVTHALYYDVELAEKIKGLLGLASDTAFKEASNAFYKAAPDLKAQIDFLAKQGGHSDGVLYLIYTVGLTTGLFPLLIFMGVGAMTDFGPLLANPKTLMLGAAAQFGIFAALLGALFLTTLNIGIDFSLADAAAIGIIGGADGPTAIYVATRLAPDLLGAIAVAAYSYMALVPMIQPPIMRALTTEKERQIKMEQLRQTLKVKF